METNNYNTNREFSRRQFISLTALAGAGLLLNPLDLNASENDATPHVIRGLLPVFLLYHTSQLSQISPAIKPPVKEALSFSIYERTPVNQAFAGLLTPPHITLSPSPSFDFGHAIAKIASEQFGGLYQKTKDKTEKLNMQCYLEACLIRNLIGEDIQRISKEELTLFLRTMIAPMITRTHTLKPDPDKGDDWVVKLTNWKREQFVYLEKLADTVVAPDAKLEKTYVTKNNFYSANDGIIKELRSGSWPVNSTEWATNQSVYGKALMKCYQQLAG